MTTGWGTAALVAATVTNGLMAGLFVAYSYAVMPGLGRTGDRTFVEAMQQMNAAILNGWFGVCFAGSAVFVVLIWGQLRHVAHADEQAAPASA